MYTNIFENNFYAITKAQNSDFILAGYVVSGGDAILICRVDSALQGPPIGINLISNEVPKNFHLYQNYPNPFNPTTKIKFELPSSGLTQLKIYDILGREIRTILEKYFDAGIYEVEFSSEELSSGIYFYELTNNLLRQVKKMVLIK
mgnify:FL=1